MNTTDAIRADAAEEEKRAREVEEAIRKADDDRRRDKRDDGENDPGAEHEERPSGEHLDKFLTHLADTVKKIHERLDAMSPRFDDMMDDTHRDDRHRDDTRRRRDDDKSRRRKDTRRGRDDDDDDAFARQPTEDDEEERKRREEMGQLPGEARPVVADARRRHALADAQSRANFSLFRLGSPCGPTASRRTNQRLPDSTGPSIAAALEAIREKRSRWHHRSRYL